MNAQPIENPNLTLKPKRSPALPAIGGVVALLLIGSFLRGRGAKTADADRAGAPRDNTKTVRVVPVTTGTIVQRISITGTLKANQNIQLNPKIAGRVGAVYVQEGQRVRRGQVLASLDDADLREQVASAQANLQTQRVKLQQTIVGLPARVAQVSSNIETARAQLGTARANFQRARLNEPVQATGARSAVATARAGVAAAQSRLKQARDTAKQTQQTTNAGISSAQSALGQAQAQLQQTRAGSRAQEVNAAQAQVNVAQANLENAETNLNRQKQLFEGGATAKANVDQAQTQYDVSRANLQSAQQNLSLIREGSRTTEVSAAEEVVNQREAALRQAQAAQGNVLAAQQGVTQAIQALSQSQATLRQATGNLGQIGITQQETRTAQEAVNQAQTGLNQAISNRAQIPVAQQDVPAARAAVQAAQVQLNQAQNQLSYARIVSPINGVVNTKNTDVGESAAPGTPLFNLVSLDDVYFEAQVPESQLASIKVNQPAQVTVTAVSNKPVVGYVTDIIRVASETLRQFRIRISLPKSDTFTPGAFARGELQTQVVQNTLTLPSELVRNEGDANYVYVAQSEGKTATVKRQDVRVGAAAGDMTQIIGGVKQGDLVVSGNASFEDGAKVKIAKNEAGGSSSSNGGAGGSGDSGSGNSDSGNSGSSGSSSSGGSASGGSGASSSGGGSGSGSSGSGSSGSGSGSSGSGSG